VTLQAARIADGALLARLAEAVSEDLCALARLHDREPDRELLASLCDVGFPAGLGLALRSQRGQEALEAMAGATSSLPEPVDQTTLDLLAVDYADIYLNYGLRVSPYESVWLDDDGLERQEPMFQLRDCYRRHGLTVQDWQKRADDHLVLQLLFLSHLFGKAKGEEPLREAATFLDEHLLRWTGHFATRVATRCGTRFFGGLALLTSAYVDELREVLADILDEPRPSPDQIEQRMRPRKAAGPCAPAHYVPGAGPGW
jgi:TorA maturation chaperone TorD